MQNYLIRKSLPLVFVVSYSGSVVKTKIQAFYNEPIYVAELGGASIKHHDQSAVPDNNMMRVSDC